MYCFQNLVSDLGTFLQLCTNKNWYWVCTMCEHKELTFLIWDIFCGACSQRVEFASIMRKAETFLITNANSLKLAASSTYWDVPPDFRNAMTLLCSEHMCVCSAVTHKQCTSSFYLPNIACLSGHLNTMYENVCITCMKCTQHPIWNV